MKQYLELLRDVMENGETRDDRTGVGTIGVFGRQVRFDLSEGFPLLTTKKLHVKSILHELLWFLSGDTNIKYLNDNGVKIWDEWADHYGDLGPVYGKQWRSWDSNDGDGRYYGVDQIRGVIDQITQFPTSRRMIVSAWNPAELHLMALPPCHCLFQFYVREGKWLDCQLYQRSGDIFLGIPYNIASYAILTHMVAQVTGLAPGEFIHTIGDLHLYKNHVEQAKLQLSRGPRKLPKLSIDPHIDDIDNFKYENFHIHGYDPHPHIKAEVAV